MEIFIFILSIWSALRVWATCLRPELKSRTQFYDRKSSYNSSTRPGKEANDSSGVAMKWLYLENTFQELHKQWNTFSTIIREAFRGLKCRVHLVLLLIHPGVSGQEQKAIFPNTWILDTSLPTATSRVHPWSGTMRTICPFNMAAFFLGIGEYYRAASVLRIPDGCRARFLRSVLNISPAPSPTCLSVLPSLPGLSPGFTWARPLSCYCTQHEPVGPSIIYTAPRALVLKGKSKLPALQIKAGSSNLVC